MGTFPQIRPVQLPDYQGIRRDKQVIALGDEQLHQEKLQTQAAEQQQKEVQLAQEVIGANGGDIEKALPQLAGKVSPGTYQKIADAHLAHQEKVSKLKNDEFARQQQQIGQVLTVIDEASKLPPEQYQAAWPQIAVRLKSVDPEIGVDPSQPIPIDQLPMVQRGVQSQDAYLKREGERRAKEKFDAEMPGIKADSEKKQAEAENEKKYGGMSGAQADMKYRFLQAQKNLGKPWTPEDQAFVAGYEKQKLLVPTTTAQIRIDGMNQGRQYPVFDQKQKSTRYVSAEEMNRAATEEPGRYTVAAFTPESIGQQTTTRAFTTGKPAEELVAFNTAIAHADLLKQAAVALKNGDIKALNSMRQKYKEAFGSDIPTNYKVIAGAYSREINKALTAGHVTDSEIKEAGATVPVSGSTEQLIGAADTYKALMQSKVDQRKKQYEQGMQGKPNFPGNGPAEMFAVNPKTKQRIVSRDGGQTWQPAQ